MPKPLTDANAAKATKSVFGIVYPLQDVERTNSSRSKVQSGEECSAVFWKPIHQTGIAPRCLGHKTEGIKIMNFGYNSLIGVLILAGDIWAILNIFQSSASNEKKLLWILVVVLLPLLGLILWFFLGPRSGKA